MWKASNSLHLLDDSYRYHSGWECLWDTCPMCGKLAETHYNLTILIGIRQSGSACGICAMCGKLVANSHNLAIPLGLFHSGSAFETRVIPAEQNVVRI